MKHLLNLLNKATPEEREALSRALHVAEQISLAEKRFEGAPKADFYERLRACSALNRFVETLHGELKESAEYKEIQIFSRQISVLASNYIFREWIATDYGSRNNTNIPGDHNRNGCSNAWSQACQNFKDLVKNLTFPHIVNVVEILHEEGTGMEGRQYSVRLSQDRKQVIFQIQDMRAIVLHDIEQ